MSSRVLRKLHGDKDFSLGLPVSSLSPEDGSDGEVDNAVALIGGGKQRSNINPYDLLNQQSNSPSESEGQEENHETEASNAQAEEKSRQESGKRKKKRKRKKSTKQQHNTRSSEDNVDDDEVERSVREVNRLLGEAAPAPSTSNDSRTMVPAARRGVLGVEHKHLNPSNELKRIFGSRIIQAENRKHRNRGARTLKSTWLVTPKENWPQIGKQGLSMKQRETKAGLTYFSFDHSPAYQAVEMKFLEAVESLHPDNIVAVINMHPYHVNALLQLSDICRMSEDLAMAAELVERALFALECAFHPSFNVALGTCRLEYRLQQNRSLYVALFKHILFVGGRACYRTALEFCKLLLSLDPDEDPLAIVLALDFYALRAREFRWLVQFFEEWESRRNLSQLPNFAFSVAVAHFHLSKGENSTTENAEADVLLQNALIMFPGVLQQLLDKCSVQVDPRVAAHTYFTVHANANQSQALEQLIQLYVGQSYHVWKEPELLPWLERNVHVALDRVDAKDPFVIDAERKRGIRYPGTLPRNILRYILLCDRKDVTPHALPVEQNGFGAIMTFDPLPPLDSENLYTRPQRPRPSPYSNTFANFFRTLLPHVAMNDLEGEIGHVDAADVDAAGDNNAGGMGYGDIRASVRTLMERMRDLMANVTNGSDGNESDGHESDGANESDGPGRIILENLEHVIYEYIVTNSDGNESGGQESDQVNGSHGRSPALLNNNVTAGSEGPDGAIDSNDRESDEANG